MCHPAERDRKTESRTGGRGGSSPRARKKQQLVKSAWACERQNFAHCPESSRRAAAAASLFRIFRDFISPHSFVCLRVGVGRKKLQARGAKEAPPAAAHTLCLINLARAFARRRLPFSLSLSRTPELFLSVRRTRAHRSCEKSPSFVMKETPSGVRKILTLFCRSGNSQFSRRLALLADDSRMTALSVFERHGGGFYAIETAFENVIMGSVDL